MLSLYHDRYCGFTVKHFHEKLEKDYDFRFGYTWTKIMLQGAGLVKKARWRGAHRKKRPRRPIAGMLLHQDGSSHRWIPGLDQSLDLIVTMDDVDSENVSEVTAIDAQGLRRRMT